ncbi:hypothetical protein AVEN_203900-1 [Araneus ventricosus]|uniref:Uncharacterized protein n=1 Tax=Araneus ventricosus TaxID=182803 RepID=A0A4Y2W0K0_ARAVE|nr:hypothetical protein AVEN_203900-1 [Araneus ventricosus]
MMDQLNAAKGSLFYSAEVGKGFKKLIKIQTLTVKSMDRKMFWKGILHESFREHDTESEEDGDSGNEEVNNLEWFS